MKLENNQNSEIRDLLIDGCNKKCTVVYNRSFCFRCDGCELRQDTENGRDAFTVQLVEGIASTLVYFDQTNVDKIYLNDDGSIKAIYFK